MAELKGLDLSHHNGDPDYGTLKHYGIQFIYHKATEGNGYVDPKMLTRVAAAKKAGLHVGVYHFARFTSVADGAAEAAFFVKTVAEVEKYIDLPLVLDIEVDDVKLSIADLTKTCVGFVEAVKKATNKPVMIYTYDSFIHSNLGKELGSYPLWLADYGDHKLNPNSVWNKYSALQYTDKGSTLGINGGVDMDWLDDSLVIQPPKPVAPAAPAIYKVKSGDTLSEIAAAKNIAIPVLKKLNKLADVDHIEVGQVLKLK